jgi:uncharacterized protein YndB with AHSA1/START domain
MTSLTLVRRIAARPSIVFDALTTPDGIACWWGPDDGPVLLAETDIRVGGRFRVQFGTLDGAEHESGGQYIEVVKPTRLGHELALDLRGRGGGSRRRVACRKASRASHEHGWNGALDKLVRHFTRDRT